MDRKDLVAAGLEKQAATAAVAGGMLPAPGYGGGRLIGSSWSSRPLSTSRNLERKAR